LLQAQKLLQNHPSITDLEQAIGILAIIKMHGLGISCDWAQET